MRFGLEDRGKQSTSWIPLTGTRQEDSGAIMCGELLVSGSSNDNGVKAGRWVHAILQVTSSTGLDADSIRECFVAQ